MGKIDLVIIDVILVFSPLDVQNETVSLVLGPQQRLHIKKALYYQSNNKDDNIQTL